MAIALTAENAVPYLVEHGVISVESAMTATAESLGGGVSNVVIRVDVPLDSGAALVLKQSLPKLRVQEDWYADRERIHRERAGIDYVRLLSDQRGDGGPGRWTVPQVLHEDQGNYLYVMTSAARDGVNWKDALLAGRVDAGVARAVGRMLGSIHRSSLVQDGAVPGELLQFEDLNCFVQLRIDPYHRATAAAHPDLADIIESEAQRMLPHGGSPRALVHGDFSPKNIIVAGSGPAATVFLLDFEVVHLGNPVFDLAFMLNHFTLKAIYRPQDASEYNAAARAFWSAYLDASGDVVGDAGGDAGALERHTMRQMGALLLARIDGKSPAEYLTEPGQKEYARRMARSILTGELTSLARAHARLESPTTL